MAAQQDQSAEPMTQAQAFIKRVAGRYYIQTYHDNGADPDLGPGDSTSGPPSFQHACGALLLQTPSDDGVCGRITFGQMKTRTELAGQRIAPLIGAFLVGDVLQKKRESEVPSEAAHIAATRPAYSSRERRRP